MNRKSSRRKFKTSTKIILAVIGGALIWGGNWVRLDAGGFKNAISLAYWEARFTGLETYRPAVAYFTRGSRDHRDVCFTFDDGPHEKGCPLILDALKKEGIHATFFVVGLRVKQHPELVRRMIAEGNEVGNHTQDHPRLDKLPLAKVKAEIRDCEINIERACGRRTTLFRPPGMDFNHDTMMLFKRMGYVTVGWNVGAHDFIAATRADQTQEEIDAMNTTPAQVAARVLDNVKPGVIILLHDNPVTAAALPTIISKLRDEGYGFKTVTEMLAELPHPVNVVANPIATDKYALKRP